MAKVLTPAELAAIHERALRAKVTADDVADLLHTAEVYHEIVDALAYEGRYQAETGEGSTAYLSRLIGRAQDVLEGVDEEEDTIEP